MQPVHSVSTASDINYDSDSTVAYDLEEHMNMEYENNSNHSNNIKANIDEVIREITPLAWLDNPLPRPQHVVTDNYSLTSPVYNPDHSPIQIDSDEEVESRASISPAPLDIPIVTPAMIFLNQTTLNQTLILRGRLKAKIF